jgi:hypothetical protein
MAIITAKHGPSATFFGQKDTNQHRTVTSKHGAVFARGAAVSVPIGRGRGDLGGGQSAPGNTANPIANGSRDAAPRPDGVRSMADPRPAKRAKNIESGKRDKTN